MAALERLLSAGKVDGDRLAAVGLGELTATAGLTWAQLLKRPEVTIEPVLGAMREALAQEPLLAELSAALAIVNQVRSGQESTQGGPAQ